MWDTTAQGPRCAGLRRSTWRSGISGGGISTSRSGACWAGGARERIRTYNTCAGYKYVRGGVGQKTDNWGLGAAEGPYEDLDGFLTDAGKVAESLLGAGHHRHEDLALRLCGRGELERCRDHARINWPRPLSHFGKSVRPWDPEMQIMAEMHLLWQPHAMAEIARALEPFDIYWIEDPMPGDGALLLGRSPRPGPPQDRRAPRPWRPAPRSGAFMEAGALDVVIMDLGWCGGLTEAKAIAGMAEAFHLPIAPHDCTGPLAWAACTNLTLNAPNALVQESVRAFYSGWYGELAEKLPVVEDGHIMLPEGAGMVTTLKPEVFTRADAAIRQTG